MACSSHNILYLVMLKMGNIGYRLIIFVSFHLFLQFLLILELQFRTFRVNLRGCEALRLGMHREQLDVGVHANLLPILWLICVGHLPGLRPDQHRLG